MDQYYQELRDKIEALSKRLAAMERAVAAKEPQQRGGERRKQQTG